MDSHFPHPVQEALSLTEFELMALLDIDLDQVKSAVSHISSIVCPPPQTVRLSSPCLVDLFAVSSSVQLS